jgi:aminoglycoside phosphotransferase (APT) family kinase protein
VDHRVTAKLHDGEVHIDAGLVRRLLQAQFPEWAGLPLVAAPSTGTVNAIYRLGDDLCVRLPRVHRWAADLSKELRWLPQLAPQLPLMVPEPVASGRPSPDFPLPWAIYRWLPGETWSGARSGDELRAAADLAQFVAALRRIDRSGAPRSGRDRPLPLRDAEARAAIRALRGTVDTDAVAAAWETSLGAPPWDGRPTWTHADLLPPNLLVDGTRISAVLDFGNVGVGDPALDALPAWSVLGELGREHYRRTLDVDDATWVRGRGFALHQALLIVPYYRDINPTFATMAERTIAQVLVDHAAE